MPWSSGDSLNSRNLNNMGGNIINVMAHGAVGDGVTDDTAAIQAAINEASTTSGTEVFLPAGSYKITSSLSLRPNVILRGAGPRLQHATTSKAATVLIRGSNDTMLLATGTTAARHYGASLRDLTADGITSGFTGTVLDCTRSVGFYTSRFEVIDNLGMAVYGAEVWDAVFDSLWVRNSGNSGPNVEAIVISDSTVEGSDRIAFNNLHSESNRYTHVLLDGAGGSGDINKWIYFNNPKVHDYLTDSELTVPLLIAKNVNNLQIDSGMFSGGSSGGGSMIQSNASFSRIDAILDNGEGDYGLDITGGTRSTYDVTITSVSLGTLVRIGPAASNTIVRYIRQGTATSSLTDLGTNSLVVNAQDGKYILDAGKLAMPATGRFYLDGGGDTYLSEVSANQLRMTVGNVTTLDVTANALYASNAISVLSSTAASLPSASSTRGYFYADSATSLYWVNGSGVSTLVV